ncbi:MAG TPA: carbon-nitrogen hydrolase [Chthoniobacteraceae bacterium]|nr:carbon-nitrogen hydrolase [Chthoniobacteraceae bacterium]
MSATRDKIKLGVIQMRCVPQPDANLAHAVDKVREAARGGATVICLPELFRSEYFCQVEDHDYFKLAEEIPGPSTTALSAAAKELGVVIVAPLFEKRGPGVYHNTAAIIDADGALLGNYRKMHIPDDPLFYEKFYFAPGDLGFRSWETKRGKIGVCICWDQWYPEAARITALQGAEILFYPTAIGWHPSEKAQYGQQQHDSWETIQRSHAIANGCYVAAANRVGHETPNGGPGLEFWGQSFVADPSGQIIARAGVADEEILLVDVDTAAIDRQRTHWPFLRDRRIDAYADIGKRFID